MAQGPIYKYPKGSPMTPPTDESDIKRTLQDASALIVRLGMKAAEDAQKIKDLESMFDHLNQHVLPGTHDSHDSVKIAFQKMREQLSERDSRIKTLEEQLAWYKSGDVHTCHDECKLPECVAHREKDARIERLTAEAARLRSEVFKAMDGEQRLTLLHQKAVTEAYRLRLISEGLICRSLDWDLMHTESSMRFLQSLRGEAVKALAASTAGAALVEEVKAFRELEKACRDMNCDMPYAARAMALEALDRVRRGDGR